MCTYLGLGNRFPKLWSSLRTRLGHYVLHLPPSFRTLGLASRSLQWRPLCCDLWNFLPATSRMSGQTQGFLERYFHWVFQLKTVLSPFLPTPSEPFLLPWICTLSIQERVTVFFQTVSNHFPFWETITNNFFFEILFSSHYFRIIKIKQ